MPDWNKKYDGITKADVENALESKKVDKFPASGERYFLEYNGVRYRLKEACRRAMWLSMGRNPNASEDEIRASWSNWCKLNNHKAIFPSSHDLIRKLKRLGITVGDIQNQNPDTGI